MIQLLVTPITVHKQIPLTISRGTTSQTCNLWVRLRYQGLEGWGEASPFNLGDHPQTTDLLHQELTKAAAYLAAFSPWQGQRIASCLDNLAIATAARAAIETARHDWIGKQLGIPLWQLWGLDLSRIQPTAVTIGIGSPEKALERLRQWQSLGAGHILKIKLGSPAGIAADQAMFQAVKQAAGSAQIMVDANGGWSLVEAQKMLNWLAEFGVIYVEQPFPRGAEAQLPELYRRSPLPIFVDESCATGQDIFKLSNCVHGINIKLMKAGGLDQVIAMIHTARALGLQVMFGCYSDSTLSNTAMAHLAPLADYLDLDSHLNLIDDPFIGAMWCDGKLMPTYEPGLGVKLARPLGT